MTALAPTAELLEYLASELESHKPLMRSDRLKIAEVLRQAASVERAEVAGEADWRSALLLARAALDNPASHTSRERAFTAIAAALASPPRSEGVRACEVRSDALSLLKEYEQWEADIILENGCWTGQNVQLTDELYERMIQLQTKRNAVLRGSVAQASPKRQYYYRMDGCKADSPDSSDCICWHDEGTGPIAAREKKAVNWRTAPSIPSAECK